MSDIAKKYYGTSTSMTINHYNRPEVRDTIQRIAQDGVNGRCGNGDFDGWYNTKKGMPKTHFNLSNEADYRLLISRHRTIYYTLSIFNPHFFTLDFNQHLPEDEIIPKANHPRTGRLNTKGYTFSVDIDTTKKYDIHDPTAKKAVEDLAQFHVDEFRQYAPNSVYVLFSGGGIYIHLHHGVFQEYFNNLDYPYDESVLSLLNGFGAWLDDIRKRFLVKYPEHEGKTKADSLNNSKRLFKSIFSLHMSKPYAVIPLDPDNVFIDFDKAKLPLKKDVLDAGDKWYRDYDTDGRILEEVKRYIEIAKTRAPVKCFDNDTEYERSETTIDIEHWPPCIKNLLALETCGEGKTRALAVLAAFMGQMGLPEQDAYILFMGTANRWNAATTNIFQSHFRIMRTPTCRTLTADNNQGYPTGRSLKILNVCKPDIRCINIVGPRYYADKNANIERLRRKLTGTVSKNEEQPEATDSVHTPEIHYSLIRINQDIPVFAGVDGRSYLLGRHDIVTLPTVNANALIKRNFAVVVDQVAQGLDNCKVGDVNE